MKDPVPGPTFEVRSGKPVIVEWANDLPQRHFLPIDHTLHGAEADKPEVRTVVHLHGGRTAPDSDGYPEDWFTPGQSKTTYYPNQQEATGLFLPRPRNGYHAAECGRRPRRLLSHSRRLRRLVELAQGAIRNSDGDLRPVVHPRRADLLSGLNEAGGALGLGVLWRRHSGEWQDISISRGRAAQVPIAAAQLFEWQLLPPLLRPR